MAVDRSICGEVEYNAGGSHPNFALPSLLSLLSWRKLLWSLSTQQKSIQVHGKTGEICDTVMQ